MDIKSNAGYPASALSNFAPHPFTIDGVECASMEGFLQSLKFQNEDMQRFVCTLVGKEAKLAGGKKKWWRTQTLYWLGNSINRNSTEYQLLLDRAYSELSKNDGFRKALLSSGDSAIIHSIGKWNPRETVLTELEFTRRLTRLREELKSKI